MIPSSWTSAPDQPTIPGIQLQAEIGRGLHSVVYRATRGTHIYAVKIPRITSTQSPTLLAAQFRREASALALVHHPGLPAVIEVGQVDDLPYIVMEYVEGRTLLSLLQQHPLSEQRTIALATTLAGALAAVHRHGVTHRDVQPRNILINAKDQVKLIDFGFAAYAPPDPEQANVLGTLRYSAPEQTGLLKRPVDGRSDLYALGALLFECLAGVPPFVATQAGELIRQHAVTPAPNLLHVQPTTSPALAAIVARLLAKDPDDRYQTAEGLLSDLDQIAQLNAALQSGRSIRLAADDYWTEALYEDALVGRDVELGVLRRCWNSARQGQGALVLVKGAVGMGKSHLGRELLHRARSADGLVFTYDCNKDVAIPFAAVRSVFDQYQHYLAAMPQLQRRHAEDTLRQLIGGFAGVVGRIFPPLASILGDAEATTTGTYEQEVLYDLITDVVMSMTRVYPAAVWLLDDVQAIDESSLMVLRRVISRLQEAPLLIIVTLSDEAKSAIVHDRLVASHHSSSTQIVLAPLDDRAAAQLISACLGGHQVEDRIVHEIVARSAGSPFAIREYVQTILDAGMLQLRDGRWLVDDQSFARLQLPAQVLPLVLARIDDLDSQIRQILRTAALLGFHFRRRTLLKVWTGEAHEVTAALTLGVQAHLIERSASGKYHFSHQSVHDSLLRGLDDESRRSIHHHIALSLDTDSEDIEQLYRLAYHYAMGNDAQVAERAYQVNLIAGKLAFTNYAYDEAYTFLKHAQTLSSNVGHVFDAETEAIFGEVCYRTSHTNEALDHLTIAISRTTDPYARAGLRMQRCYLQVWSQDNGTLWKEIFCTFAELDERFQTSPWFSVTDVVRLSLSVGLTLYGPWRRQRAAGRERERLILLAKLYELLGSIAYLNGDLLLLASIIVRAMDAAQQIGPSPELVRAHSNYAIIGTFIKRPKLVGWHLRQATVLANRLAEPGLSATVAFARAISSHMLGRSREAERLMIRCLEDGVHLLDLVQYAQGCNDLAWNLYLRGYTSEAWQWVQRGLQRLEQMSLQRTETMYLSLWAPPLLVILGNVLQADEHSRQVEAVMGRSPLDPARLSAYLCARIIVLLEQNELGQPLEDALRQFKRLRQNSPRRATFHVRHFYVLQGHARLMQAIQAPSEHQPAQLRKLKRALEQLDQTANVPTLRGHYLALLGGFRRLQGDFTGALQALGQAESIAYSVDSPWISFEVARQRNHLLSAQGQLATAHREGLRAYELALEHGWVNSARWIRAECGIEDSALSLSASTPAVEASRPNTLKLQRHLDALLQVSLTWATVRDPDQQAQIALDAVIRILGAERGFLFLLQQDTLVFRAGRDANSNDVRVTEGYSRTLIERVRITKQALVVSSTDDGIVNGIESVVTQNLRSVMVAPLLLEGKLLGVVYLDNRLAWGIFSQSDVEILRAIANHIALALETARTAQLEINIAAERQQRRLAETLRSLATILNSSLNLSEVLDQTLSAIAQLIPYDSACIALCHQGFFQFVALKGSTNTDMLREVQISLNDDALFNEMNQTHQPIVIPDTNLDPRFHGYGENRARSWLGIPLIVRNEVVGFMAIDRSDPHAISERDAEIGTIFASQAAIAIANARLFGEVERLATTDGLTEVSNRRYFFELAEREWNRTRRYDHPLSAMMLDIDHFKRVNDTYGHAIGDVVLRTVAQICRTSLRDTDFLGRYGGEEFAILLPDTELSAAHITAERLSHSIAATYIATEKGALSVTVSIGIASVTEATPSVASLLDRADRGLYIAKETGRNRVVMA